MTKQDSTKKTKKQRSDADIALRSEEAGKGIVVTSAPGMSEAELAGAQTAEEAEFASQLLKEINP